MVPSVPFAKTDLLTPSLPKGFLPHGGTGGKGEAERSREESIVQADKLCHGHGHAVLQDGLEAAGHGPHY